MSEFYVNDVRSNDDASLNIVPKVSTHDELQQYFGIEVERQFGWDITPEGEYCWKLVGFEVRTGVAAYIPLILQENGDPFKDILVVRWWPDVAKFDQAIKPHYRPQNLKWDGGFTNENGNIGMAYGSGNIGGPTGGPDVIWVSASPPGQEPQYSDAVSGLGWIGGTDHLNPNPIFQAVKKTGSTPPVPPSGDALLVDLDESGQIVKYIPWIMGQPDNEVGALGLFVDGEVIAHIPWIKPV